jgi:hypothetical protein
VIVWVDVIYPVTLSYCPSVVPVIGTLKVQVPPAASDPPEKDMVMGDVVESEPPQVVVGPLLATDRPAGKTSVKATPVKAEPAFVLVMLKVSVDVTFLATEVGEKLFVIVGGLVLAQPPKIMLSRYKFPGEGVVLAPAALILKVVVYEPVVVAV